MRATVQALWRYPVKSMLGEPISSGALGERGIAGDRAYALVDVETGKVASAKRPRRWGALFECRARFVDEPDAGTAPPPVEITLPDGTTITSDDHDVHDALSRVTDRAVRLSTEPPATPMIEAIDPDMPDAIDDVQIALGAPGTFFDGLPVHLLTTATLTALSASHAGAFDPRRFRPNLVIETDGAGFVEDGWVDQPVTIGDAAVYVLMPTPRCVMTTLPQSGLPQDPDILRTIAARNRVDIPGLGPGSCAGVYGLVTTPGRVQIGDTVTTSG